MIAANGLDFYQRYWAPAELVVSDMERLGLGVDVEVFRSLEAELREETEALVGALNDWAGQEISWRSPAQVAQLLYGTIITPATKNGAPITPKGFGVPPVGGSLRAVKIVKDDDEPTGEAALHYLMERASPEDAAGLRLLLDFKERDKLASFCEALQRYVGPDGRIHCQLGPNTETGRLSSKNPNLQNIPVRTELGKKLRRAFVARAGHVLVCLDYEGLEWRILAHILAYKYQDQTLVDEILAGIDPHSATVVRMAALGVGFPECRGCPVELVKERFPVQRGYGKILNYSINYGKTGAGLGVQLKDEHGNPIGEKRGEALITGFLQANPGIARFHRDIVAYARKQGFVRSLLGRHRYIPELYDKRAWVQRKGERLAKNVIQNGAADIVTLAMLRCNPEPHPELRALGWFNEEAHALGVRQLLQVHDELLFEVPEENAARAKEVLSHAMAHCLDGVREFKCPLGVSGGYGHNWLEAGGK